MSPNNTTTLAGIENGNGQASQATGPRTEEGKAKARRNALRHGLAGHGVIYPEELADQIQDRKDFQRKDYHPDGVAQELHYERICIDQVLLDQCVHLRISAIDDLAQRAFDSWDEDQELAAVELMGQLGKKPEVIQRRLLQTKQGCEALIRAWRVIANDVVVDQAWDLDRTWPRVLDLLGVPHNERRHNDPGDLGLAGTDPKLALEWVFRQIAGLEQRKEKYLNERDKSAQADAQAGLSFLDAPKLQRLFRYEMTIFRRIQWSLRELRRLQKEAGGPLAPLNPTPPPQPPGSGPAPQGPGPESKTSTPSAPPASSSSSSSPTSNGSPLAILPETAPSDRPELPVDSAPKKRRPFQTAKERRREKRRAQAQARRAG